MDKTKKETLEELMKKDGVDVAAEENKADAIALDEPKKRIWLIVLLSVVATLLVAGGGYVAYQSYYATKKLSNEEKIETPATQNSEQSTSTPTSASAQVIYTNASLGLNLRQAADSASQVLKVIPFGTKLTVLETQGDWYKVEYDNATGWCAKLYTAASDPLVYKNTDYSFQLTFPATWSTYAVVKRSTVDAGATAYYDVNLATTDTATYSNGVAPMFVLSVYTPSQWTALSNSGEPAPTLLKQTSAYVFGYSIAQATPADLTSMRAGVSQIVATFQQQ